MRVLFVISGLGLGGAERQVVVLGRELARLGHEVSVYTLSRETPRMDELDGTGVSVIVDHKRRRLDLGVLARLRRHIRCWRPDIVHGFLYDGHLYARLAGLGAGVPVLNSERSDNYELSLLQRTGYRLTARLCDGVVANSYAGAAFARRLHRLPGHKVHVVWNGIELQEIDGRLARGEQPALQVFPGEGLKRLCMVGSIQPGKDHRLALRVVRQLVDDDPSWRLLCVGEAHAEHQEYKQQVLAERDRLKLEPFVQFVGQRRDVPEIMAGSDLLLVTSVNEGFPNVVLEAMACGLAVASTDYSDVRRILPSADQVAGSRDAREIAQVVVRCHRRRAELAQAQRRWVERHATASASAAALLDVYGDYMEHSAQHGGPRGAMKALRLVSDPPAAVAALERHIRRLGSSLDVLEAGCGRKWPLRLEGVSLRLTGVDMDATALGARGDLQRSIVGDLRDAQLLPRDAYDVVYSSFVLEHVDGAERALENFVSWLRPGGMLVLRVPDRASAYGFVARVTPFRLHVLYKRWIERMPNAGKPGFDPYPTHYDEVISRKGIHDFCRRHGCRILEEYGTGSYLKGRFGALKRAAAVALWALSLGRLAWRHNNLTFVIERAVSRRARAHLRKAA
jgi:glycosyltransferase involved in cell wall biosynthesis